MPEILFVDDEPAILKSLKRIFRNFEDWTYHFASSPKEAIEMLAKHNITVLVSDHKMPQMEGAEFLAHVKEKRPDTVRMMLTGQANLEAVQHAVNSGEIFRFILKPWDDTELKQAVKNAVEYHRVTVENRRLNKLTQTHNEELIELNKGLEEKVQLRTHQLSDALHTALALNGKLEETLFFSTRALASMIQMARPEVGTHSRRVAEHARAVGSQLGMSQKELNDLEIAALLHDNGKLAHPPFLVEKSVKDYTAEEREIYEIHPITGAQNLQTITGFEHICTFIRTHHERYNGRGFPNRVRRDSIPKEAYIIGIIDLYDHLINLPNPNREFVFQHAFQRLADSADEEFPGKLVQIVLDYAESLNAKQEAEEYMQVGLIDIAPNMRLAKDIYGMSGTLLLAGGSSLTAQNIRLIRSIAKVDPIAGKIYVSRKTKLASEH
jgi:response regulator RpfG family c-di-GMP phosphodiesterase